VKAAAGRRRKREISKAAAAKIAKKPSGWQRRQWRGSKISALGRQYRAGSSWGEWRHPSKAPRKADITIAARWRYRQSGKISRAIRADRQ